MCGVYLCNGVASGEYVIESQPKDAIVVGVTSDENVTLYTKARLVPNVVTADEYTMD